MLIATRRLVAAGTALGTLAASACNDEAKGCKEGERSYRDGDHWTCADGCNYCECRDGELSHTAKFCGTLPGPAAGKLSCGSMNLRHGESWPCEDTQADGCSLCRCEDGVTMRTPAECAPQADR